MSDAMDPRHADPERYVRESAKPRPAPVPRATEDFLRTIISRGVVTPPSTVDVSAIKRAVQALAYRVANGKLEPCPACQEYGVPIGTERYYDAAGDRDTRDCETCHGWTVVTAPDGGTR